MTSAFNSASDLSTSGKFRVCNLTQFTPASNIMRIILQRATLLSALFVTACLNVSAGGIEVILQSGVRLIAKTQFVTPTEGVCIALEGLYKTTDGGSTWRNCLELMSGEAYNTNSLDVSISSTGIGLFVSTNRMFQTLDTGSTWTELTGEQKPKLKESWSRFMRVYSGASGFQQVITNEKLVASRHGVSGEWTYDTIPVKSLLRDAALVGDTSAIILLEGGEVEYRTSPNRLRSFPNAPLGYRVSADGPLVTISDRDKVWISRDGCETWIKADLQLAACSLAVVKDGCIVVVEDDRVHYSSDSGHSWTAPIKTGIKYVITAQLLDCSTFFGFGFFNGELLRSTSGIGPTVVSAESVVRTSSRDHGAVTAARWDELEELLLSNDGPGIIVGYNSLGEVILGPTPITRTDGSLDGFSSRLRGQLIWLTVAAAKQSKTVVLLP